MAVKQMGLDGYLSHKTGFGGQVPELTKWKDNKASGGTPANAVDVLLHRAAGFTVVYRHGIPRIASFESRQTKRQEIHVYGQQLICAESEEEAKGHAGRYRGRQTPDPKLCGLCRYGYWLFDQVCKGALSWTDEVLRWEADDPRETKVIHAGGWYNAFGSDKLTAEELADLKKAHIFPRDAWKEACLPKASYIYSVVEHQHPENGVQVAVENSMLGDRVKKVIMDRIEQASCPQDPRGEKGNPLKHPYVLRWKHFPNENEIQKKYDCVAMPNLEIGPEVMELISDESKLPSLGYLVEPFDAFKIRAEMEKHSLIDVPWDHIFPSTKGGAATRVAAEERQQERAPEVGRAQQQRQAPPPEEEEVECDKCRKPMAISASACPHCGHKYEVETAPPEPVKAPLRSRSEALKQAAPAPQQPVTKAAPKQHAFDAPMGGEDDDLPF